MDLVAKNPAGALQRAQAAIDRNPKSGILRFLEAKALLAEGDTSRAEVSLRKSLELAPDFREPYIALAQLFIGTRKPDLALEELRKVLAKNPRDTGTLLMMGVLQESKGDYTKARDTYEKLLALDPKFSLALNNLAYVYCVQPDKGIELARKARQLLPDDPAVADTLGWATYLRGDYAAALPLLQESTARLSAEAEAQYHVGMAHYMMGHEDPARIALQKAVQAASDFPGKDEARQKLIVLGGQTGLSVPETMQILEGTLAQHPSDVAVLLRLGALYEQSGLLDKARDVSERAVKINPKAVRALLALARIHGARPDGAPRALAYAKSARAAAPNDAEVAYAAGRATFQAGQYEWAYSILQESRRQQAGNPDLAYDFAWSAYSMGRVAEAEQAMQDALRIGTNFSQVDAAKQFLELVSLAGNPTSLAQAAPRIQNALQADPAYVPALMAAALSSEQRKTYAEARKLYEQVLGRYPQFLPAIRNLALICANHLNDPGKAYELAAKARQALGDDMELAQALGRLAYGRGDYRYAAQLLAEVQLKKAAVAETYFYLGLSQAQLKEKADSATNLRQALSMNLEDKLATEANRVLAELK
jgi:tetratricopeptide (TPR) repeat protein